jgi:3-phosphoshikimate 1-carboxyvinyltransferase
MARIVEPLQAMGVPVQASPGGTAPLILHARPQGQRLRAIDWTLPVASAQVKTCLLLAALAADGPTTLREPGPSRDHSERMLGAIGVKISDQGRGDRRSVSSNQQSAIGNQPPLPQGGKGRGEGGCKEEYITTLSPSDGQPLSPLQMCL